MAKANASDAGMPTTAKKRHVGRYIGLGILAIVIIGGVYFYYAFLSGGIATVAFQAGQNPSTLGPAILQKINSNPELTLSYVGSINFTSDPPFHLSFMKYHNDTRVTLTLNDFPHIGNFSAVGISINNGTTVYVCYQSDKQGYRCYRSKGSPTDILKNLSNQFGASNLGNSNVSIKSISPSYYNGMPCFQISGGGKIYGSSEFFNNSAILSFNGCFSSKLYVPLQANATLAPSNGGHIYITLQATNVSQSSTDSKVTSLPGPLVNSTG